MSKNCDLQANISIIIALKRFPTENLRLFFESTKCLSTRFEVILVANEVDSTKDSEQILTEMSEDKPNLLKTRLVVLSQPSDKGPAFERNLGALLADSSIFLFADDDIMIVDDLSPLLEMLKTDKCQGVQPLLVRFSKPEIIDSSGDFAHGKLPKAFCRDCERPLDSLPKDLPTEQAPSLRSAFMLIKKEAFFSVGGFDEAFFFNYEDVDLGWRMTCAGYRLLFVPSIKAQHKGSRFIRGSNQTDEMVLRLKLLNRFNSCLKISSYWVWPWIFTNFVHNVARYEGMKFRLKQASCLGAIKDLFLMNKLFFERFSRARMYKEILKNKFQSQGKQRFTDMSNGKRFIYQFVVK